MNTLYFLPTSPNLKRQTNASSKVISRRVRSVAVNCLLVEWSTREIPDSTAGDGEKDCPGALHSIGIITHWKFWRKLKEFLFSRDMDTNGGALFGWQEHGLDLEQAFGQVLMMLSGIPLL